MELAKEAEETINYSFGEPHVAISQEDVFQIAHELEKLEQENEIMRHQLGIPDADIRPDSIETVEIEIRKP